MEIHINLTKLDWSKFQTHVEKELPKKYKTWRESIWFNFLVWFFLGIIFMVIFNQFSTFQWQTAVFVAMIFFLIFLVFILNLRKLRKSFEPLDNGVLCGSHVFKFTDNGIESKGKGYNGHHSWDIVKKIERASGMVLIYLDTAYAFIFPESELDDPEEFYSYVTKKFTNAKN